MDLKETELLGGAVARHWYYRAKLAMLQRSVAGLGPVAVLDVGAGSGFFARALLAAGQATAATCVDPGYAADHDEMLAGRPLAFRRHVAASPAALVLMMDVLEHVDDDAALVRDYAARVAPGTWFFVTVPAFRFLWSGHDVFLDHRRRYSLRQIEAALRDGGLVIERGAYFYGLVFPLAAAVRLIGRVGGAPATPKSAMRPFGALTNAALFAACAAELPWFRANRLAGLTATVLARKP